MANEEYIQFKILDPEKFEKFEALYPTDHRKYNGDEDARETRDRLWLKKAKEQGIVEELVSVVDAGILGITKILSPIKNKLPRYEIKMASISGKIESFQIDQKNLFTFKQVKDVYFAAFGELPFFKLKAWEKNVAMKMKDARCIVDDINEMPLILDIINKIENSEIVFSKEELGEKDLNTVWLDKSKNILFVMSKAIEPIAEGYKKELCEVNSMMADYLVGGSVPYRIGMRQHRFWQFNPEKFNLVISDENK